MLHVVASLLVGLAPLILLASIPVFIIAIRTKPLLWFGLFGFLLLVACAYTPITNIPLGLPFDSIDHGLLTGVPTLLVMGSSGYTLLLSSALLWHALCRIRGPGASSTLPR